MKICLQCHRSFSATDWKCPHCGGQPLVMDGFPCFAPHLSADTGYKDAHFHELVELEARNFWFRARNALILWALSCYFPMVSSFLEVGCGTGFVLAGIAAAKPKLKLAGGDLSRTGLAYAAARVPSAKFIQMDARAIPFADEFDVIGAFDVLEHIEDDSAVLGQMYGAVQAGGGIILTVPQHDFLWSSTDVSACHVRRYSARELAGKVRGAGFTVVRQTSIVALLLPLMLLSRWRQRRRSDAGYDSLAELRLGKVLNSALEKVMAIERLAIRAGLNFPAGGSLLLIARKP